MVREYIGPSPEEDEKYLKALQRRDKWIEFVTGFCAVVIIFTMTAAILIGLYKFTPLFDQPLFSEFQKEVKRLQEKK